MNKINMYCNKFGPCISNQCIKTYTYEDDDGNEVEEVSVCDYLIFE